MFKLTFGFIPYEFIGVTRTGDDTFPLAPGGADQKPAAMAGLGVDSEENTGDLGIDHTLNNHGNADVFRLESSANGRPRPVVGGLSTSSA